MADPSMRAMEKLSERLEVDHGFLMQCLEESAIEILETSETLDLGNGTTLRLRRLERLCHTFNVDVSMAALLLELTQRITQLESELRLLKPEK